MRTLVRTGMSVVNGTHQTSALLNGLIIPLSPHQKKAQFALFLLCPNNFCPKDLRKSPCEKTIYFLIYREHFVKSLLKSKKTLFLA